MAESTFAPNKNRVPPNVAVRVIAGFGMVGALAEASFFFHMPFLFPAIGPTVLAAISRPSLKQNNPINVIAGHFLGAGVALALLWIFGIYNAPSTLVAGFTQSRVLVVALAIALTTLFSDTTPVYHPPAAATTLLVALGVMSKPPELAGIAVGVLLIAIAVALYEYLCPKKSPEIVKSEAAKIVTTS